MTNLCMLYGLTTLHTDSKKLYETGYFSQGTAFSELILDAIKTINKELRPQIIPIVESF